MRLSVSSAAMSWKGVRAHHRSAASASASKAIAGEPPAAAAPPTTAAPPPRAPAPAPAAPPPRPRGPGWPPEAARPSGREGGTPKKQRCLEEEGAQQAASSLFSFFFFLPFQIFNYFFFPSPFCVLKRKPFQGVPPCAPSCSASSWLRVAGGCHATPAVPVPCPVTWGSLAAWAMRLGSPHQPLAGPKWQSARLARRTGCES